MQNKKKRLALFAILLLAVSSFVGYRILHYTASNEAVQVSRNAQNARNYLLFDSEEIDTPAIIFYPGAFVDTESYSLWAQTLSEAGYPVYLLKVPFDLAVFSPSRADTVIEELDGRSYILGGHSLGGVMASRFAAEHSSSQLRGIFFLASYPDKKGNLTATDIAVLSLTAENDTVLNQNNYQEAKNYLPINTTYHTITGGNHAGFGSYGSQKGDGKADISTAQQQQTVSKLLLKWLAGIK